MNIEKYPTLNEAIKSLTKYSPIILTKDDYLKHLGGGTAIESLLKYSLTKYSPITLTKDDYLKHLGGGTAIGAVIGFAFGAGMSKIFDESIDLKFSLGLSYLFGLWGFFIGGLSLNDKRLQIEIQVICRESETSEVLLKYTLMKTFDANAYPYQCKYTLTNIEELTAEDLSDNLETEAL